MGRSAAPHQHPARCTDPTIFLSFWIVRTAGATTLAAGLKELRKKSLTATNLTRVARSCDDMSRGSATVTRTIQFRPDLRASNVQRCRARAPRATREMILGCRRSG